jgi:5-methylcytosine-specific restriction endonuclease McrA
MKQSTYSSRLQLPVLFEKRMLAIIARSSAVITTLRREWFRAVLKSKSHLRIFFGKLIVITIERKYIWLALDATFADERIDHLQSISWDTKETRPKDAFGTAYPTYTSPPSRNVFYDPAKDMDGLEWPIIEMAHLEYLHKVATSGRAPDSRTKSNLDLEQEIYTWGTNLTTDLIFDLAVEKSTCLNSSERKARLRRAPKKPQSRLALTLVFDRNPDVVAEVLARADGKCELCFNPAPFYRSSDGTPYLEVHHLVRLADGGDDTIENAVAACPNCHRQQHFG